jgi:hypothetical protein
MLHTLVSYSGLFACLLVGGQIYDRQSVDIQNTAPQKMWTNTNKPSVRLGQYLGIKLIW